MSKSIFIHSWFRSGSTYLWSKFRSIDDLICYYEPLHEKIEKLPYRDMIRSPTAAEFKQLRHPTQEKDYFFEYHKVMNDLKFSSTMSYDRYLLHDSSEDRAVKQYIDQLLEHAKLNGKTAILAFCRSQLRSAWMRQNFDVINIALIRNPLDQWNSFNVNWYFIDKVFRIAHSLHIAIPGLFQPISKIHEFLKSTEQFLPSQINSYPLRQFSHEDVFSAFLIIWLISSIHSLNVSDFSIDIDELSENNICKCKLSDYLSSLNIKIKFDDCNIPNAVSKNANISKVNQHLKELVSLWNPEIRYALYSYGIAFDEKTSRHLISSLNFKLLQSLKS